MLFIGCPLIRVSVGNRFYCIEGVLSSECLRQVLLYRGSSHQSVLDRFYCICFLFDYEITRIWKWLRPSCGINTFVALLLVSGRVSCIYSCHVTSHVSICRFHEGLCFLSVISMTVCVSICRFHDGLFLSVVSMTVCISICRFHDGLCFYLSFPWRSVSICRLHEGLCFYLSFPWRSVFLLIFNS